MYVVQDTVKLLVCREMGATTQDKIEIVTITRKIGQAFEWRSVDTHKSWMVKFWILKRYDYKSPDTCWIYIVMKFRNFLEKWTFDSYLVAQLAGYCFDICF